MKHLDELTLLQLWLQVLVLGQTHVDSHVHHAEIGVAETGV
jgi:hypothetical protein